MAVPSSNTGFATPQMALAAWSSPSEGTYQSEALDLACLGAARNDPATTVTVSLTARVRDFQSGNALPGATVDGFDGANYMAPFTSSGTDTTGMTNLQIPIGKKRIGFAISSSSSLKTIHLDRSLAPATTSQTIDLTSISNATAATLPALIGETRIAGTALVLGLARDCQAHLLSNFIATVSSTPLTAMHVPGATSYYFSDSVGLPVHHNQAMAAARDGRFMIINVAAAGQGYVQVWGFRNASELTSGTLTLIAELAVPLPAEAALATEHDPRTTQ
jgi:hypothetical protein